MSINPTNNNNYFSNLFSKIFSSEKLPPLPETPAKKEAPQKLSSRKVEIAQKHYTPVSWAQFAHIHNTSLIKSSCFDQGGYFIAITKAYLSSLDLLKKTGCFISCENVAPIIKELSDLLNEVLNISDTLPLAGSGKLLTQNLLEYHSGRLADQVRSSLNKRNSAYFCLGYVGTDDQPGHTLSCKVSCDKNRNITVYIFNRGEGLNQHPVLDITHTCELHSYSYYPVILTEEEWEKRAEPFFCHLLRFYADLPEKKEQPYSASEIYDLLKVLGPLTPSSLLSQADLLKCKPQYVGDCSEKAIRNILLDYLLVEKKFSTALVKKLFLNVHLASILAGYFTYKSDPQFHYQQLMIHACEDLGVHLLRCKNDLEKEDFYETSDIQDYILKEVRLLIPPKKTEPPATYAYPTTLFEPLPIPSALTLYEPKKTQIPFTPSYTFPKFNPFSFNKDLTDFIAWCENNPQKESIYYFLLSLPIPTGKEDDLWNFVPQNAISPILNRLLLLQAPRPYAPLTTLVHFILYAVADCLARRLKSTKLDQFNSPFPDLPIQRTFILLAHEALIYDQVLTYFSNIQKNRPHFAEYETAVSKSHKFDFQTFEYHPDYLALFGKENESKESLLKNVPKEALNLLKILKMAFLPSFASQFTAWENNGYHIGSEKSHSKKNILIPLSTKKFRTLETNELILQPKKLKWAVFYKENQFRENNPETFFVDLNNTSNNALTTLWKKEEATVKKNVKEFLLISRHDKLKIGLVLNWLHQNFKELKHPEVQQLVEFCFFSPSSLKEQFIRGPEIIEELRSFLDKSLKECANETNYLPITLFLIRVSATLHSYMALTTNQGLDQKAIEDHKQILKSILCERKSLNLEALAHLITLQYLFKEKREEYFIEIFQNVFLYQMYAQNEDTYGYERDGYFLKNRLKFIFFEIFQNFLSYLSQQKNKEDCLNRVCNAILSTIAGNEHVNETWEWKESFASSQSASYVLDFTEGYIYKRDLGYKLIFLKESDENTTQGFGIDSSHPLWMAPKNGDQKNFYKHLYLSYDEKVFYLTYYSYSDNEIVNLAIQKPKGNTLLSLASFENDSIRKFPILKKTNLIHYFKAEATHSSPSFFSTKTTSIITYCQSPFTPYMQIDLQPKGVEITRLNEKGELLPIKLANLEKLDPKNPLFAYTLKFAKPDEIICFINEKTEEIEELSFSSLDLSFKNQKGSLVSQEFPEFRFMPHLNSLSIDASKVIVLRNPLGDTKVLLITPEEIKKLGSNKEKNKEIAVKYMAYELDSHQEVKCTTFSQSLFLIFFLKAHGHYEKAWNELKKLSRVRFNKETFSIFKQFLNLKDQSSYSLAFNLHLVSFVVENMPLAIEKNEPYFHEIRNFFSAAIPWYLDYLRIAEEEEINEIPFEWRLSQYDESKILSTFMRENIHLPKVLENREELLHTINKSAVVNFTPQEIERFPLAFSKLVDPEKLVTLLSFSTDFPYGKKVDTLHEIAYPNRISEEYVISHFFTLYKRAKNASLNRWDPFDFSLIAILNSSPNLGSLLFYVRHFSESFQKLDFSFFSDPVDVFTKIVQRASQIKILESYPTKMKTLKERALFDYSLNRTIQIPSKTQHLLSYPSPKGWKVDEKPFNALFDLVFKITGKEETPPPLFAYDATSPLASEWYSKLKTAHKELSQNTSPVYSLQPEAFAKTQIALDKLSSHYLNEKRAAEERVLHAVNNPYQAFKISHSMDEKEYRLRLNSRQTYLLDPEELMKNVILTQSMKLFAEHRPMLSQEQTEKILEDVHLFYHFSFLSLLAKEATILIKKLEKNNKDALSENELFSILNYTFHYSPVDYPEIAFMKVNSKKHPRPEQVKVHIWLSQGLSNNENRLFQLEAGGGKSSYLIPLLILRLKRYQVTPLVLVTPAMYDTEKENLGQTLSLLGIKLKSFQISINEELSLKKLQTIYSLLKKDEKMRPCILTPQTLYALRLRYFALALKEQSDEYVKGLQNISLFLKKNGFLLGDEAHRNFDPMTQAIFGMGIFNNLEEYESLLLFELMKPLLGSKITKQGSLEKEELGALQKRLVNYATSYLKQENSQELVDFWINKGKEPSFLVKLSKQQQEEILLVGYFLDHLLEHLLRMKTDYDHLLSNKQGDIETPAYHKNHSHAQFKDPYLACCLTIKGIWHRGLNEEQLKKAIEHLKETDNQEKELVAIGFETASFLRFEKWMPSINLRSVKLSDPKTFQKLFSSLKYHPDVLEYFFFAKSISHIGYSAKQFTSSPAHLMDVKGSILFSATPLIKDIYPNALQAARFDDLFAAKVVAVASSSKNQNFIFPDSIDSFFNHLKENNEALANARYMIDAGGFLCDEFNENVAKRWLESSDLDGIIYFQDGENDREGNGYVEKNLSYLSKKPNESFDFLGTDDLSQKFKNKELNFDSLKIGFFYDSAHAESANFPSIPNTAAYVLDGESLTFSHALQGIMRLRGFLNPKINQTLIWVVQKDLKKKREGKNLTFSSELIFGASFKNEVKKTKPKILMKGFQEISFQIEKEALKTNQKQLEAIKQHANGFCESAKSLHWSGSFENLEKTEKVFWDFANSSYKRFSFCSKLEVNDRLFKNVSQTIREIDEKIPKIYANFHESTVKEVHQKCVINKETSKIEFSQSSIPIQPVKLKQPIKLTDPKYPDPIDTLSVQKVFTTPHLTENFYFEWNQLQTGEVDGALLKETVLKPIDFILIVVKEKRIWAEALSNDVAASYIEDLDGCKDDPSIKHKAFIVMPNGKIYHAGHSSLALKKEEIEKIVSSNWFKDVLIDVALINGRQPNNARFQERAKKWTNFNHFSGNVSKAHSQRNKNS